MEAITGEGEHMAKSNLPEEIILAIGTGCG